MVARKRYRRRRPDRGRRLSRPPASGALDKLTRGRRRVHMHVALGRDVDHPYVSIQQRGAVPRQQPLKASNPFLDGVLDVDGSVAFFIRIAGMERFGRTIILKNKILSSHEAIGYRLPEVFMSRRSFYRRWQRYWIEVRIHLVHDRQHI